MNSSTDFDWSETLTGEALALTLLARALYEYPEKPWIDSLIAEDIFAEVPFASEQPDVVAGLNLLQQWSQANPGGTSEEAFGALRADHTRLFVGSGRVLAAPWESVYFNAERMVFQQQTLEVREWYARYGLEAINLNKEPDDHIGLELAFLAHLAKLGLTAFESHDLTRWRELLDAQRNFLTGHLLRWAPPWCGLVIQHAQTDFYRGIALLTRGTLLELASVLEIPLPEPVHVDPLPDD